MDVNPNIPPTSRQNLNGNVRDMFCTVPGMTTIKAKVIDGFHLELEKGIPTKTGDEVFIRIIEKKPIASLRGAWGSDVDSADFVETLRKSRTIEPL